ncbi:class I SAM-dependent methyltransferase [Nocardia wallacei]|uniref:class I SAM-dependent methyltransferase n=1 Tax=Nocardia wallacei TaxID=480035 RepID=UPI002456ABAA|nr:class I SAM-dependent methyltransferase [Nocardia wallacei]
MERQPAPVVNHHAGRPGFSGPIGLVVGLGMYVTGRRRARTVAELVAVGGDDHVVDIGCGPGVAVAAAARRGARVTGVDPSPMMLRLARNLVRGKEIRWAEGAAENLPIPDEVATVAWAISTVHHWPDITGALAEVRRVLTSGGRFVVIERQSPGGATGLASHGWTEGQAQSFAEQCRAAHFADLRADRYTVGGQAFWAVRASRP